MRSNTTRAVVALLFASLIHPARASAATLHVPADYPTIQSCINAAVSGQDECVVAPGTYNELINFLGKAITLRTSDGPAVTIIDGTGLNPYSSVVTCTSGEGPGTVLSGFTITGGSSYPNPSGGLYIDGSSPTITNNIIKGNRAANGGGGVMLFASSALLANNIIAANSARFGGGLLLWYCDARIVNNTIIGNEATGDGSLCLLEDNTNSTVANNIIAFNSSGISQLYAGDTDSLVVRNNCVYGNHRRDYSGLIDYTGTNGNISVDPLLADSPFGNLHLRPDSPCVNAGDNADLVGNVDIDRNARIAENNVDIGADEFDGTLWPTGPYTIVRVSPVGNDVNNGSSWALSKRTVLAGIDAAAALGGEVWVQSGTYVEEVLLHPYVYLYGGFAGIELRRDDRNWIANTSILDGHNELFQAPVIVGALGGGYRTSAIDGFRITFGNDAVYLENASPSIVNCTIIGNGTALRGADSSPLIANTWITGNVEATYLTHSWPTIVDCTITGNETGIGTFYESFPMIVNSIIAFNNYSGIEQWAGGYVTMWNNCVYGNKVTDYYGLNNATGTDGNISQDPMFSQNPEDGGDGWVDWGNTPKDEAANNDYGNLRLQPGSPCINAGDPNFVPWPGETDLDGHARVLCGQVDMGAYEFGIGDYDCNQTVNLADFSAWPECMTNPAESKLSRRQSESRVPEPESRLFPTGCESFDFDGDGDVDLSDLAQFMLVLTQ